MRNVVFSLITIFIFFLITVPQHINAQNKYSYTIDDLRSVGWAAGCGTEVVNYYLVLTEHFSPGQIMEFNLHQAEALYKTSNLSCKTLMSLASTYTDSQGNELANIANYEWDPLLGNTYITGPDRTYIGGGVNKSFRTFADVTVHNNSMALIYPGTSVEGYIIGSINNVERDFSRSTTTRVTKDLEDSIFNLNIYDIAKAAVEEYEDIIDYYHPDDKDNKELEKWIIRTYIDSVLTSSKPLNGSDLLEVAKEDMDRRMALPKLAKEKYAVTVNPNEVNNKIKETISIIEEEGHSDFFEKLSEGLGISLTDYYYDWEYDNFEQQLVGEKVYPKIGGNLPKGKINSQQSLHDYIFETFNNELTKYLPN